MCCRYDQTAAHQADCAHLLHRVINWLQHQMCCCCICDSICSEQVPPVFISWYPIIKLIYKIYTFNGDNVNKPLQNCLTWLIQNSYPSRRWLELPVFICKAKITWLSISPQLINSMSSKKLNTTAFSHIFCHNFMTSHTPYTTDSNTVSLTWCGMVSYCQIAHPAMKIWTGLGLPYS